MSLVGGRYEGDELEGVELENMIAAVSFAVSLRKRGMLEASDDEKPEELERGFFMIRAGSTPAKRVIWWRGDRAPARSRTKLTIKLEPRERGNMTTRRYGTHPTPTPQDELRETLASGPGPMVVKPATKPEPPRRSEREIAIAFVKFELERRRGIAGDLEDSMLGYRHDVAAAQARIEKLEEELAGARATIADRSTMLEECEVRRLELVKALEPFETVLRELDISAPVIRPAAADGH